jgi:hypothetical protein
MVRRQPDGAWCIVAEAWCLDEPGTGHTQLTPGPAGATSQVIPPRFP